ncbi:MAG: hypothetical protein ABIL74_06375 [candidate division WOR-3 bacterium]
MSIKKIAESFHFFSSPFDGNFAPGLRWGDKAGIIPYLLEWLKRHQYLEILIDWKKIGRYSEQSPILA